MVCVRRRSFGGLLMESREGCWVFSPTRSGRSMGSMRQVIRPSSISILTVVVLSLVAADASGLCALVKPKEAKSKRRACSSGRLQPSSKDVLSVSSRRTSRCSASGKGGGSEKQ